MISMFKITAIGLCFFHSVASFAEPPKKPPGDGNRLPTRIMALEARIAELESVLIHFSRKGDDIYIDGANLHITNGQGYTDAGPEGAFPPNGLGNLIIG